MRKQTTRRVLLGAALVVVLGLAGLKTFEKWRDNERLRASARGSKKVLALPPDNLINDPAAGYEEDYVVPPGTFRANHGSSLVELPDRSLLCAWYAGRREAWPDVRIYLSRLRPRETRWSAPQPITAYGERAEWSLFGNRRVGNPTLYVDDEGILWMFYAAIQHGGWSGARVDYKTSPDMGQTWSQPRTLVHMWSNLPRSKPLRLGPNRFMLPLYHNVGQKHAYTATLTVSGGKITARKYHSISGAKHTQAALVRKNENEILAYLRDPTKTSLLFARFELRQQKWSPAERLSLPNPNSAVDAERTADGRILLVFNDDKRKRLPLTLAWSENGRDFHRIVDLENATRGAVFSYPALLRASDGTYHLSYSDLGHKTIKHVQFSEAWLQQKIAAAESAPAPAR